MSATISSPPPSAERHRCAAAVHHRQRHQRLARVCRRRPLNPSSYSSSIATDRKYDEVRMQFNSGGVSDFMAEPPTIPIPSACRSGAHRRGVQDPLTAAIMRVPGNGDTFVPPACNRRLAIFDGRMRYDLQLSYKRLDKVKADKGYRGTVVVCAVQFVPVAGHVPSRPAIRTSSICGHRDLARADRRHPADVPYRISVTTPLGQGIVQATQFVSVPHSPRPTPTSARH